MATIKPYLLKGMKNKNKRHTLLKGKHQYKCAIAKNIFVKDVKDPT